MKALRFLILAVILAVVAFAADYRTELEYTVPFDGFQKCLHKYTITPDGAWDHYAYVDSMIITHLDDTGAIETDTVVATWTSNYFAMTVTPLTTYGLDSMRYWDSCSFGGGNELGIAWTSPEYTYKITPRAHNAYAYRDTFIFAADTYAVTWTSDANATVAEVCDSAVIHLNAKAGLTDSIRCEDSTTYYVIRPVGPSHTYNRPTRIGTDTAQTGAVSVANTVASIIDSLVAIINAKTGLKDSVLAQDSGTYIKLISKNGGDVMARWTQIVNDSTLDTLIHPGVSTVAMACDSLTAKINASAAATYLTAVDSATYIRIWGDDSLYGFKIISDSGATAAKVAPGAAYRRVDTTIYYPTQGSYWPFKPSDWDKVKLEYDFTKQASLTNCSLVHVIQFSNDRNWDTCRKISLKTDTLNIARDSLFSTSGWNLHKYMTATDTLLQWDEMRLLFIRIMVLSDTGAAFLTKADSSYPIYIDHIIKGWNGDVNNK
jgi:hypothetical protein